MTFNYSRTKRFAVDCLGPKARVSRRKGLIQIYVEHDGDRLVFGEGADYAAAARDMFRDPGQAKETLVDPTSPNSAPENSAEPVAAEVEVAK